MPRLRLPKRGPSYSDPPLAPDELLAIDNLPAPRKMPRRFQEQFSDRRLFLSGASRVPRFHACGDDSFMARLAPEMFQGRLGQYMELRPADGYGDAAAADPFRPDWAGYLHHPKMATVPREPDLLRADGRRMRPQDGGVFDPDGRGFFFPSGYPMHCIGRIEIYEDPASSSFKVGTATLVGSRTILTAAHCMPRDGSPGRWGVRFVPAYFDGTSTVRMASWCEAFRVATVDVSDETQAFDVAVAKLYDPLGEALGWFGARAYDDDWEDQELWTLVGYPTIALGFRSENKWPTIQRGIRVVDDDPDGRFTEVEHMGDASEGNSGGPLFGTWPEGPYVIGTHSGYEYREIPLLFVHIVTENNNVAGGGAGMVDMVRQARIDWP